VPGASPPAEAAADALRAADEAFARFDVDAIVAHLSAAVRALTAADDRRAAAMACARLGDTYENAIGNLTAARAWYVRAQRLVEDEPACIEQGWVAIAGMGCDADDPAALLAAAELALDRARQFGDLNLETKALADAGLAHVQAGRIAEGMALLDEAMALACGPADDADVTSKSVCSFFTACYHAADVDRAGTWAETLRRHGLIGLGSPPQLFLNSHCQSVEAAVLLELGRWSDAEAVLLRAKGEFEAVLPMPAWHPDLGLADLRIRQGRLADAEALLFGKDHYPEALLPAAALHLGRGDHALARQAARRGIRAFGDDRLRAAHLLVVLADAELASGDVAAAAAAVAELEERLVGVDVPRLRALAARAAARVQVAQGDPPSAIATLEAAIDGLAGAGVPWLRLTLLVELVRSRRAAGDEQGARADARTAAALLGDLDATLGGDDAALLAELASDGRAPRAAPSPTASGGSDPGAGASLGRSGGRWVVACAGTVAPLRATKGLAYVAELLRTPGQERHVLDLVDRVEGVQADGISRTALGAGDAGEVLDARARTAYRHRIEALRGEVDEALAAGRLEEAEALEQEADQLLQQLAAAFGLGGRSRRSASAAERARLNVTRALRTATTAIAAVLPDAGAALDRGIRTGTYCTYEPAPGDLPWAVEG
jgi:hypothetical protein